MKKILSLITLGFIVVCVSAQAVSTVASLLNPSSALPATCRPYSVRASSAGISICNAAGNGWNTAATASGAVTSITGTANQVTASAATGAVTLSLPQSIHTGALPQFTSLLLSQAGSAPTVRYLYQGTGQAYTGVDNAGSWYVQDDSGNKAFSVVGNAPASALVVGLNSTAVKALALTNLAFTATAPTITSAGTSPTIVANGTAAGAINVGTGGTATTIVLAMPAATTGWNCHATNVTATAANRADQSVRQTASTTTSVTLQNQTVSTGAALAFTASDSVRYTCVAY